MSESSYQKIRAIFFDLIGQGGTYTTKQVIQAVRASGTVDLTNSNLVYAVLHTLRNSKEGERIGRTKEGAYYLKTPPAAQPPVAAPLTLQNAMQRYSMLCDEIGGHLQQPSYEMSEAQFAEYKQLHLLVRDVQKLLKRYAKK